MSTENTCSFKHTLGMFRGPSSPIMTQGLYCPHLTQVAPNCYSLRLSLLGRCAALNHEPLRCAGCTAGAPRGCSIPSAPLLNAGAMGGNQGDSSPAAWRVQWDCQLSGLRDLNQSVPAVRAESLHWLDWYQAQFGFQGLRIDAMGHVPAVRTRPETLNPGPLRIDAMGHVPAVCSRPETLDSGNMLTGAWRGPA